MSVLYCLGIIYHKLRSLIRKQYQNELDNQFLPKKFIFAPPKEVHICSSQRSSYLRNILNPAFILAMFLTALASLVQGRAVHKF